MKSEENETPCSGLLSSSPIPAALGGISQPLALGLICWFSERSLECHVMCLHCAGDMKVTELQALRSSTHSLLAEAATGASHLRSQVLWEL